MTSRYLSVVALFLLHVSGIIAIPSDGVNEVECDAGSSSCDRNDDASLLQVKVDGAIRPLYNSMATGPSVLQVKVSKPHESDDDDLDDSFTSKPAALKEQEEHHHKEEDAALKAKAEESQKEQAKAEGSKKETDAQQKPQEQARLHHFYEDEKRNALKSRGPIQLIREPLVDDGSAVDDDDSLVFHDNGLDAAPPRPADHVTITKLEPLKDIKDKDAPKSALGTIMSIQGTANKSKPIKINAKAGIAFDGSQMFRLAMKAWTFVQSVTGVTGAWFLLVTFFMSVMTTCVNVIFY
eukprot:gnl/TRDRNA2_/TRDRNA2_180472_c0_seq1.p1 gnl/TRDRNA2_/TRDRNA2_180472_c0~~gnl/TRDRNA2_/TRDRNA2_180472_c0_seq1.p1  ORF type:complete len:294 (-),score=71.23 gnl/TRDRNA2_/TRDRNA2_180472_c0_seq1:76-957(-)